MSLSRAAIADAPFSTRPGARTMLERLMLEDVVVKQKGRKVSDLPFRSSGG